jgi:glucuronate isomerase
MASFIHDDFLLESGAARELYHRFAAGQPIYDYHCHLPVAHIAANHRFADLTEIWLAEDHYKWRAMRANGTSERFCTGDASPREKFGAFAATLPYLLGNPLYHWSHLEIKRYFGYDAAIGPANADQLWQLAHERLPELRVHDILAAHRVAVVCTTDDPADSLDQHALIRRSSLKTRVYPCFRPDRALALDDPGAFNLWLDQLAGQARQSIASFDDLLGALRKRHDDFHAAGCRLSDHGLEQAWAEPCTPSQAAAAFQAARGGRRVSADEHARYASFLMLEFGRWDARRGWTKQLHLGAMRDNRSRMRHLVGSNAGFDSIGDFDQARSLVRYLDALDATDELPRMVLYNIHPQDNYPFATIAGSFQDGSAPGKIQWGSGWWFLDQKDGIEWQLKSLSSLGLLRRFIGMVTDSRSFMSFPRHEYFRRVLCNLLGRDLENGNLPPDPELIGTMVKEICFSNARDCLRLEIDPSLPPSE